VLSASAITAAVDAEFERTRAGLPVWPDPHGARPPNDDEYSRVTDAARWRIVGARADAWIDVLIGAGLGHRRPDNAVRWAATPPTRPSRADGVVPVAADALPVVIARSRIGDVDDAGVTLGVGDPAVAVAWFPECGCDACDSGAVDVLDELDGYLLSVVSGGFRYLSKDDGTITFLAPGHRSGANVPGGWRGIDRVLADASGWDELTGASWLRGPQPRR
jgi:hypothetical protein